MRYRGYILLVCLTVMAVACSAAETTSEPRQPGFSDAIGAYRWLERHLSDDELQVDDRVHDAIELVFVDPDERSTALDLAERLLDDPDLSGDMYELLIRATPNSEVLYTYVESEIDRIWRAADEEDTTRGAHYGWNGSYALESALTGFEATGDERFLDSARDAMLEALAHRDDVHHRTDEHRDRVLEAWGTSHLGDDGEFFNVVTHAGRIAAPMAWYAWIVDGDDTLHDDHGDAAEKLLAAAQAALLEFDDEFIVADDGSYGYYWRATHDRIDALNHQTSVGEAFLWIAELVDDPYWTTRAGQITEFVRRVMYEEDNGTVVWQYSSTPDDPQGSRPEPIWKGQVTIRFMLLAERLDAGFDGGELEAVAESIRINVLRDGERFNAMIAEELEPLDDHLDRYGGLNNLVPFVVLDDHDPELGERLYDVIAGNPEVGGWFAHPKTAVTYAHRLRQLARVT